MRFARLLTVAALTGSLALATGCTSEPPPVSDKVAEYYKNGPTRTPEVDPVADVRGLPNIAAHDFRTLTAMPDSLAVVDTGKNASGMAVAGARLTHGTPSGEQAAGYVEQGIGKPVQKIGAEVIFSGSSPGQLALVAWESSLDVARNVQNGPVPNGGIHFVAGPKQWHLGVFVSGKGERILRSGPLSLPSDGVTVNRFEILRNGADVFITFPNGFTLGPITDPDIATWTGEWATWELYEQDAAYTPAAIISAWAG